MSRSVRQSLIMGVTLLALVGARMVMLLNHQPETRRSGIPRISLEGTSPPQAEDKEKEFLRVIITPVIGADQETSRYSELVAYLGRKVGLEPLLLRLQPYSGVERLLVNHRCELALVCSAPFVRGERNHNMEALAVPQIHGSVSYHSVIIVPRSASASSLLDLRGHRFALADMDCTSAWMFPSLYLRQKGEDENRFFKERIIAGSHERAARAVTSGLADGAAVNSLVYHGLAEQCPSVAAKSRVILRSSPLGNPAFVVHPHIEPGLKERLRSALLEMDAVPAGREALSSAGIERFVSPSPSHFASAKDMVREWESR